MKLSWIKFIKCCVELVFLVWIVKVIENILILYD